MTELPRTVHQSSRTLSSEQTRDARACAWAYVFDCYKRRNEKEGGPATALNSAKGGSSDSSAKRIVPKHS